MNGSVTSTVTAHDARKDTIMETCSNALTYIIPLLVSTKKGSGLKRVFHKKSTETSTGADASVELAVIGMLMCIGGIVVAFGGTCIVVVF